jgi:two-component system, NtrC family, response regulator AtoC
MSTEAVAVDPRAVRAFNKRRDTARANEAPLDWFVHSTRTPSLAALAKRFAAVPTTPVIIQGERGCGVQALARSIHDDDPFARDGRFRTVPAQFVSAAEMRGWLNQGTLVIEDVENLKGGGQSWVADALGARNDRYALRIIATSRYSVGDLLLRRHLSQELIHALDVFRLVVPPLRERREDIVLMARAFLKHHGEAAGFPFLRFTTDAETKLADHAYPANVCELRNVVERAVALRGGEDGEISSDAIIFYDSQHDQSSRARVGLPVRGPATPRLSTFPSLAELEKDYLTTLIRDLNGRRTEIAKVMGVSYPTVLKKIARHRLDVRAILSEEAANAPQE